MYLLKNSWISITRNKGRNILIGIIILVISMACTVTLAIKNTASDLIASYTNAYDKEVTISFDRSNMMKDFDFSKEEGMEEAREQFANIESYDLTDIKNYADSNYINDYYYTNSVSLNGENVDPASNNSDMPEDSKRDQDNMSQSDFTLTGYSSIESMSEFVSGTYTMSEIAEDAWSLMFDGNYVFINEELATLNSLELNDKINLTAGDNIYEFEILGIYKENEENESKPSNMFSNSVNNIITNASAVENIITESELKGNINATFIIDSYENVEALQEEFYNKGLPSNYVLETNEELATAGVSSISNVNSFASTFLILTLVIGSIVLFVINMINIRERKYEIGVYRTIGLSKLKLTLQFMIELIIVSLVALLLGAAIGAGVSKPISNSLLSNEISNSEQSTEEINNNFGGPMQGEKNNMNKLKGVPSVQAYDSIDAVVDMKVIIQLLAIGLSLVLVSSIASTISIQRFSPLTILKERS